MRKYILDTNTGDLYQIDLDPFSAYDNVSVALDKDERCSEYLGAWVLTHPDNAIGVEITKEVAMRLYPDHF